MSHTTEIENIVFNDVGALKLAVKDLQKQGIKCELREKTTARAYYTNQAGMSGTHDYVLHLADSKYDVAFVKDEKAKGYMARTDLFMNSVANVLGVAPQAGESAGQAALGKLNQSYAVHAATRQAAKQGYSVRKVTKPDGTIQLVMNV